MAITKDDVVGFIDNMTVLEMSGFVKELEEKYGVTAAAPVVAMAAPAGTLPSREFTRISSERSSRRSTSRLQGSTWRRSSPKGIRDSISSI